MNACDFIYIMCIIDLFIEIGEKTFDITKTVNRENFWTRLDFYGFMKLRAFVIVFSYFEWLDIMILFKEIYVQILIWGVMKAYNFCNIKYLCSKPPRISCVASS